MKNKATNAYVKLVDCAGLSNSIGGVKIFLPVVIYLFLATGFFFNTNQDEVSNFSGDVIPYLDLGSDNNGCPDALKSRGNQSIDSFQNTSIVSMNCDPCDPSCSSFADKDSDNVGDLCDLDDDNDGIPDTDEGWRCRNQGGVIWDYNDFPPNLNPSITLPGLIASAGIPTDGPGLSSLLTTQPSHSLLVSGVNQTNMANAIVDGDYIEMNFTTTPTVHQDEHITGISLWREDDQLLPLSNPNTSELFPYEFAVQISTDPTFSTGITTIMQDQTITYPGDNNRSALFFPSQNIFHINPSTTYYIRFYFYNNSTSSGLIFFDDQFIYFCQPETRDTDSDGIADHLDLDSDNDGILDVNEAGHTAVDADNDGIIDGVASLFGSNGLFDGVETVADSDVINYTISDSETIPDGLYDAYELDSDGDGCYDAEEEGVTDGDSDGIAGAGTPTVDANGLVTTNIYTDPPNNTWQNPLIGPCITEVCTDGIDNDGDGLLDCNDPDCIASPEINFSQDTACINETISIASSDIGSGTTYSWNFGTNASPSTATGIGPHNVYYTDCGNKAISLTVQRNGCTIIVDSILNIAGSENPIWDVLPQDLILECNSAANLNDSINLWLANNGGGFVSDNCNGLSISHNYSGLTPDCGNTGNTNVQFTATNSCGNSAVHLAVIQIVDTQGPNIQMVNDTLVDCDAVPSVPSLLVSDNCDPSPSIVYTEVVIYHPTNNWKSSTTCSMLYGIASGNFDDKGTLSTTDDEMSFILTIIGQNTGPTWSTIIAGNAVSGNFATSYPIGPFLTGGSTTSFTITDDSDSSCTLMINVDASDF